MKFRDHSAAVEKIEAPMAPMIDVVFQLLIFFMLTLKIVEPEGDFNINMPISAPQQNNEQQVDLPPIKVRLLAAADGALGDMKIGQQSLGAGDAAYERLNITIRRLVGSAAGTPMNKDVEIEIDSDHELEWQHTLRAISACSGRLDKQKGAVVQYVEKIKFAPPRKPKAAN